LAFTAKAAGYVGLCCLHPAHRNPDPAANKAVVAGLRHLNPTIQLIWNTSAGCSRDMCSAVVCATRVGAIFANTTRLYIL